MKLHLISNPDGTCDCGTIREHIKGSALHFASRSRAEHYRERTITLRQAVSQQWALAQIMRIYNPILTVEEN
jgi:hypothetical protein